MNLLEKQKLISLITDIINSIPSEDEHCISNAVSKKAEKVELLTIKECIEVINGLSECTLRSLIKQNKIPYTRAGTGNRGKILISKNALIEYFN